MEHMIKRYIIFTAGVIISAFGISMITKAGLGTSPVTSLSYVLTFVFPYSLGAFTLIVNIFMFLFQMLIQGKEFEKIQFLQIPATLVFSACIDLWMYGLSFFNIESYWIKLMVLLIGCAGLGFGIALEVVADVLILPGEGLVRAISARLCAEFGKVKTCFDLGLIVSAVAVSFFSMGRLEGIREGTLIAALSVGGISHVFIGMLKAGDEGIGFPEKGVVE